MDKAVQSTSSDRPALSTDEIRTLVTEQVASTIQQTLPALLQEAFKAHAAPQQLPNPCTEELLDEGKNPTETLQLNSRLAKYYTQTKEATLCEEVTTFLTTAFTKRLSKEVWSDLMQKYPPIKGMDNVLLAPTMETGTKEYIKQKFGYHKTKEVFTSDDGLVEKQAPFLAVARPIAAAHDRLEEPPNPDEGEEGNGPDPDEIKAYLEDALVLLGNANFRLNAWGQKRFAEYLTDMGKRILKEDIPTDKHLFPDKFHQVIQSEHDHSKTNAKVIATPSKPPFQKQRPKQPFRAFSSPKEIQSLGTVTPQRPGPPSPSNHDFPKIPYGPSTQQDYCNSQPTNWLGD